MSVNSVSSTSIYGQRNVFSGMASGMDTESMIENMTQATRLKIQQQKQKKTLLGWKQEAYRGISSQLIEFSKKYSDYQSDTNLRSPSFFGRTEITTSGKYADLISATGKTSSEIVINGVEKMATSASYSIKGFSGSIGDDGKFGDNIISGTEFDINGSMEVPKLNGGTMTFTYGNKDYTVNLGENVDYGDPDKLQEALNKALESVKVPGGTLAEKVKFTVSAGGSGLSGIHLGTVDPQETNNLRLKSVSDNVKEVLGFDPGDDGIDLTAGGKTESINHADLLKSVPNKDLLAGKQIVVSLNGKNATITLPGADDPLWSANGGQIDTAELQKNLNDQLTKAFGNNKAQFEIVPKNGTNVTVSLKLDSSLDNSQNTLRISGGDSTALGLMGLQVGDGNRINLDEKLGNLYASDKFKDGKITINGTDIEVNADMTMRELMDAINNSDAGVKITYSELSDTMKITAEETGAGHEINLEGVLAEAIFEPKDSNGDKLFTEKEGQDAVIDVTVNGEELQLTRSSNEIEIDGLKVQIKGTFGDYGANGDGPINRVEENNVSFTSKPKTDEITEAVKSMIEDFNKMFQDVYKQMSTKPSKDYQPLTDEQREEMTEDQIKKWEDKAKEGLLFGDSQLRSLQSQLRTLFSPGGEMSKKLEKMGIKFEWSTNSTDGGKLMFDEKAFRAALEEDPEMVAEVFTKPSETDAAGNKNKGGVMVEFQEIYNTYASTSIVTPGILVARAGSPYSANSLLKNTLQTEIDGVDKILNNLNTKLKTEIDRYNKQFTQLEMLVSQMNSQSASLAGLMGG